jgi:hypothetical protein
MYNYTKKGYQMSKVIKVSEIQFCSTCKKNRTFKGDNTLTTDTEMIYVFCVKCGQGSVEGVVEYFRTNGN